MYLAAIDNARIREILPLLRPRSAEPTFFSQTVFYLLIAGLVTLAAAVIANSLNMAINSACRIPKYCF